MRTFALLLALVSAVGWFLVGAHLPQAGIIPAEGLPLFEGLTLDWALMFGLTLGFLTVWLILPISPNRRLTFLSTLFPVLWAAYCVYAGFGPNGAVGVASAILLFWILGVLFPYRPAKAPQS